MPRGPFKNGPGEIGGTVALGRVTINAGDIVLGDIDGIAVVPRTDALQVYERLTTILDKEASMEAKVAAGAVCPDWLDAVLDGPGTEYVD